MTAVTHPTRRVALLEASVAERIAAGEVIERPASVVKELVENAIDAGSTRIFVEMRDGGQSYLQVSDDGCGMGREDAVLALSRFATSKIATWDDMERLHTLGFRGEALPSIIAVSRLDMLTRAHDGGVATRIVARGSEAPQVQEAGGPSGTTVTVTDLFFNTPARRKFMKSAVAEAARIVDLMGRFSLLHTNVHFRLTSGEREVFNLPQQYGLVERLKRLWHVDARGGLVEVQRQDGEARLRGVLVCPPTFAATRTRQVVYVNGRLVVNLALSTALAHGFEPLLPERKFPMAVLFIEIPAAHVDVNVHPTKSEVRFLYPRQLFKLVKDAVSDALTAHGAQPQDHVDAIARLTQGHGDFPRTPGVAAAAATVPSSAPHPRPDTARVRPTPAQVEAALEAVRPLDMEAPTDAADAAERADLMASPARESTTRFLPTLHIPTPVARVSSPNAARWQVLAQLHRTYIVCLRGDELWLVDQHTAHERINYERLAHLFDGSRPTDSQPLLFPLMLELPADEAAGLAAHLDVFEELGYAIEHFGGETFVVRALPADMKALSRVDVLRQIISEVTQDERAREPARLRELLRATTACRASVMAGDLLTREEMETLLVRLEAVERGSYCPHGRPVSVRLTEDDLARLFGRR